MIYYLYLYRFADKHYNIKNEVVKNLLNNIDNFFE